MGQDYIWQKFIHFLILSFNPQLSACYFPGSVLDAGDYKIEQNMCSILKIPTI